MPKHMHTLVLGGFTFLLPVYGMTNLERYSVFHGINVNFQPSKVCLQHLKVHRMFSTTQVFIFLSLLVLMHEPTSYSMHTKYVCNFYNRIMRYSCLLGNKYKFTANASNKDHKITKIHHFVA